MHSAQMQTHSHMMCHRAGNGSLRVTHDPCDPRPMGHRGRHRILAQALHRFIDYPALYLDIVYVHTTCYIIAQCTCKQTAHTGTCKFRVLIYYHCHNI